MNVTILLIFFISLGIVKGLPDPERNAEPVADRNAESLPTAEANSEPSLSDFLPIPNIETIGNIPIVGEIVQKASDQLLKMAAHFFKVFKTQFNKTYSSEAEEKLRFQAFLENFKLILSHKSLVFNGTFKFELGFTQFADLTDKEFEEGFCKDLKRDNIPTDIEEITNFTSTVSPPAEKDWRKEGAITRIKDQKSCGACWTYAAAGAMEAAYFRKSGKLLELSTQDLLDCTGTGSCMGGHYVFAYKYSIKNKGVNLFKDYPYEDAKTKCRHDDESVKGGKISNFRKLKVPDEKELKKIVANEGPVAIGVDSRGWKLFKGTGVFYDTAFCTKPESSPDHAVLLVGYGTKDGEDYWLIKNSWGEDWGDKGYIRIARNKNNHCHVATDPVYPIP